MNRINNRGSAYDLHWYPTVTVQFIQIFTPPSPFGGRRAPARCLIKPYSTRDGACRRRPGGDWFACRHRACPSLPMKCRSKVPRDYRTIALRPADTFVDAQPRCIQTWLQAWIMDGSRCETITSILV